MRSKNGTPSAFYRKMLTNAQDRRQVTTGIHYDGVCEGIGHDHNGKPLYRYDENKKHFTEEIWDNSIDIMEELKAPSHPDNHYVFRVPTRNIKGSVYVPRY